MNQSTFQRGEFSMATPVLCVLGKCSEFSLVFGEIVEVGQKGEEREQRREREQNGALIVHSSQSPMSGGNQMSK